MNLAIPVLVDATIRVVPVEPDGQPATVDGPLVFAVAAGSEPYLQILAQPEADQVVVRTLAETFDPVQGEPFEAELTVSGDVLLGDDVEVRSWPCRIRVYQKAEGISCEVLSLEPVLD